MQFSGVEFDADKDRVNREKHGIGLERGKDFDIVSYRVDARFDYGEVRYRAGGYLEGLPACMIFSMRGGMLRVISLLRAHLKELERNVPKLY